jgi:hypothetical protein
MMDEEQAAERMYNISAATGYTTKEVSDAIVSLAPYMQDAWNNAMEDESLWQRREELYRETFLLGRFRWYRRFRVWWIRRQLRSYTRW